MTKENDSFAAAKAKATQSLKQAASDAYNLSLIYGLQFDFPKALYYCDLAVRLDCDNQKYKEDLAKLQSTITVVNGDLHIAGDFNM